MNRLPSIHPPRSGRLVALAACAFAWSAVAGLAQGDAAALPPAHLSYIEGRVLLDRESGVEAGEESMPVVPGDRVRTEDGRAELLIGDGSLVQLDAGTTLDVLSDARLRLLEGRLALLATGAQADRLQIDTPEGSVVIRTAGEYRVRLFDADGRGTVELSVVRGRADLATDSDLVTAETGERSWARTGEAPAYPVRFNAASLDGFDQWALDRAMDRRDGGTSAQYVPATLHSYADVLDTYGSWDYEPTYGQVWYPRVAADWRPYHAGRWRYYGGFGWTWVGGGRWGWPTHHYGRWGLSTAGAWFWIPGATWGPAWVSWAIAPGYVSWCPIGYDDRPVIGWGHHGYRSSHGHGADRWRAWTVVPRQHFGGHRMVSGVAVDGRGLGQSQGRAPAFVAQDRPPAPPRGHVVADRGANGLGVAVPRGSAGAAGVGERRPGLVPTRGDRRASAGPLPAAPQPAAGPPAADARSLRPPTGRSARTDGSRGAPPPRRGIERTPEDLAGGSRSAIAPGSRPVDRIPGDVGRRPSPAPPAATTGVTTRRPATTVPGWRADQVPVYRGGRLSVDAEATPPRAEAAPPQAGSPARQGPGAYRTGPPARSPRGGTGSDAVGNRARQDPARALPPPGGGATATAPVMPGGRTRGGGHGVPSNTPAGSSMLAPHQAPGSSPRVATPPASPPASPPPQAAPPPRQAPSGERGGSAVPRGGSPPSRRQ